MCDKIEPVPVSNAVCVLPNCYRYKDIVLEDFLLPERLETIRNMTLYNDDTFIVSYPRTGTTWTEKILAGILDGSEKADTMDVEARFPFIEFTQPCAENEELQLKAYDGLQMARDQKRPRFLKTHLVPTLLPDLSQVARVILITRDPKDTLVSHYHFYQNMNWVKLKCSFDSMFEAYVQGEHSYSGYFKWHQLWAQTLTQHRINNHCINFESLKADPEGEIMKLGEFIGNKLSPTEISRIRQISGFQRMKQTVQVPGIAGFIRSGAVGEGQTMLNEKQREVIDEKMRELKEKAGHVLPLSGY